MVQSTTFDSEEQFFAHFDLPFIPPAVRRNGSEIDRVDELSGLVHSRTSVQTFICIQHGRTERTQSVKWSRHAVLKAIPIWSLQTIRSI